MTNVADEVYVGDITYIRTQQGWLCLAVVIDLFSRKVVGWSMDDNMEIPLVNNALLVHHERFKTRAETNQAIFEYIEMFYNRQRIHSTKSNGCVIFSGTCLNFG